ncbi:MAG: hypothetical protein ACO3DT_16905 [Gammaproteobacteria bacterium]
MSRILGRLLLLLWAGGPLLGCSGGTNLPEDEIRNFIAGAVEAAERRSSGDLTQMIHDSYLDQRGYNKQQVRSLLRVYFLRHKNIHLFTRIGEIELLGDNQATARLHVAMAGSVISDIDAVSALRARIYGFELRLVKQDEWLLQHASWKPASLVDLE